MQSAWMRLAALAGRAGPYVLIEIFLPGGTLLALLLYLFQRYRAGADRVAERDGLEPLGMSPA
jgi:hypothetical protein